MDVINEYIKQHKDSFEIAIPRIVCKDGFSVSVQASAFHYCSPRYNDAYKYVSVELGYPSQEDPLIEDYADSPDLKNAVYPYVPIDIANELIKKHGGIA